jgi:hypothetical protein
MLGPPGDMTETPDFGKKGAMDALSDVLRVAHLTGGVFLHANFFEPSCIQARVPREHCGPALGSGSHLIIYHYVIEGEVHIRAEGADRTGFVVCGGEIVLLPRNDPYLMGSDLSLSSVLGRDIVQPPKDGGLYSIHHGGNGKRTRMICGFHGCAGGEANPVITTLPPLLKMSVNEGSPRSGFAQHFSSLLRIAAP